MSYKPITMLRHVSNIYIYIFKLQENLLIIFFGNYVNYYYGMERLTEKVRTNFDC